MHRDSDADAVSPGFPYLNSFLLLLGLTFIGWIFLPEHLSLYAREYTTLHTVLETIAVVLACLLFAACWFSPNQSLLMTSSAILFFGVSVFDIFHMMSDVSKPDLFSPNTPHKSAIFWLTARYLSLLALVTLLLHQMNFRPAHNLRNGVVGVSLAIIALLSLFAATQPDIFPSLHNADNEQTTLKKFLEYFLMAGFLILAVLSIKTRSQTSLLNQRTFTLAALALATSEFMFTFYGEIRDYTNLAGHIYKVFAYGILVQGVMTSIVRIPYQQISRSEKTLKELTHIVSHHKSHELFETLGDFIFQNTRADHILILAYDAATISIPQVLYYSEHGEYRREARSTRFVTDVLETRLDIRNIFYNDPEQPLPFHIPDTLPHGTLLCHPLISENRGKVGTIIIASENPNNAIRHFKEMIFLSSIRLASEIESEIIKYDAELLQIEIARNLEEAREEERKIVARDIHDDLGGSLAALKIDISLLSKKLDKGEPEDKLREKLDSMRAVVDQSINDMRRIINDLRLGILDDLGLAEAIEWKLKDIETQHGIQTRLENSIKSNNFQISRETARVSLFRLISEALTNVIKHAQANAVTVRCFVIDDLLHVEIEDDGCGIPAHAEHKNTYGMIGMRERSEHLGGSINFSPGENGGTRVSVTIPYDQE